MIFLCSFIHAISKMFETLFLIFILVGIWLTVWWLLSAQCYKQVKIEGFRYLNLSERWAEWVAQALLRLCSRLTSLSLTGSLYTNSFTRSRSGDRLLSFNRWTWKHIITHFQSKEKTCFVRKIKAKRKKNINLTNLIYCKAFWWHSDIYYMINLGGRPVFLVIICSNTDDPTIIFFIPSVFPYVSWPQWALVSRLSRTPSAPPQPPQPYRSVCPTALWNPHRPEIQTTNSETDTVRIQMWWPTNNIPLFLYWGCI